MIENELISLLDLYNITNIDIDNLTVCENDTLNIIRLFSRINFDETFLLNLFINENIEYRDVETPLNPIDLNSQTRLLFKEQLYEESICSICLENFNEDDIIIKLDCEHIYHNPCLEKWLSIYNNKCPKCRKEVGESKPNI